MLFLECSGFHCCKHCQQFFRKGYCFTCQAQLEERGRKIEEMGSPSPRTVHHGWIQPWISADFECENQSSDPKMIFFYIFVNFPLFFHFSKWFGDWCKNPTWILQEKTPNAWFWPTRWCREASFGGTSFASKSGRGQIRRLEQLMAINSWDQYVVQKLNYIYR